LGILFEIHRPNYFCWTILSENGITMTSGATGLVKFEECLERLEKIVHELEKGEVPLEKSLTLFEEGMQLSATCKKQLEEAEGKVEILLKQNGKLQSEPFEPPAGKPARK
jgi:exodeoxyribonuclease VII small subunit